MQLWPTSTRIPAESGFLIFSRILWLGVLFGFGALGPISEIEERKRFFLAPGFGILKIRFFFGLGLGLAGFCLDWR